MTYRERITKLKIDRRELAGQLGMSYTALSSRLSGFTPWQKNEEYKLIQILDKADNLQRKGNTMDEKELSTIRAAILRAHFAPIARRTFGTHSEAVIKFGFSDGIFALGEDGSPGVLDEDDSILTSEKAIVTELRRRYGDIVGPVSVAAKTELGKTMSSEEYNAKSANPAYAQELSKFFSSGGTIGPDAADAQ